MKSTIRRHVVRVAVMMAMVVVASIHASAESVSFWTQHVWNPVVMELAEEFTAETGIEVEVKAISYGTEELFVALAGGAPPDVFTHGAAALGAFGALNQMQPLESVIAEWDFIDDLLPNVLSAGVYNGVQVAVPWIGVDVRDLVYRTDFLEEVGLTGPPTNWDELVSYGQKLVRKDADGHKIRSAINLPNWSQVGQQAFAMFLNQQGGSIVVDGKSGLSDPRAERALDFHVDIFHEYDIANPEGNISVGTVAMGWFSAHILNEATELGVVDYLDMATFPYPEDGQPSTFMAVNWAAVPKGAKNPEGAFRFLEFLLRPENQSRLVQREGYLPAYRSAVEWDWVRDQPLIVKLMRATEYGVGNPAHERWFDMRGILVDMVQRAQSREVPPAAALAEAHKLLENILSE